MHMVYRLFYPDVVYSKNIEEHANPLIQNVLIVAPKYTQWSQSNVFFASNAKITKATLQDFKKIEHLLHAIRGLPTIGKTQLICLNEHGGDCC